MTKDLPVHRNSGQTPELRTKDMDEQLRTRAVNRKLWTKAPSSTWAQENKQASAGRENNTHAPDQNARHDPGCPLDKKSCFLYLRGCLVNV